MNTIARCCFGRGINKPPLALLHQFPRQIYHLASSPIPIMPPPPPPLNSSYSFSRFLGMVRPKAAAFRQMTSGSAMTTDKDSVKKEPNWSDDAGWAAKREIRRDTDLAKKYNPEEELERKRRRWRWCCEDKVTDPISYTNIGVQVLSVKITELNIDTTLDKDRRVGIYGSIIVEDGNEHFSYLYNRKRDNCEYVKIQEPIMLMSPLQGIDAQCDVIFTVRLYVLGREKSEDKLVCDEYIDIFALTLDSGPPDGSRIWVLKGDYGVVEVDIATFVMAFEAAVEIHSSTNCRGSLRKLIAYLHSDRRIYETIYPGELRFSSSEKRIYETILFDGRKIMDEDVYCFPDGKLLLWRSVLIVPFPGTLQLEFEIASSDLSSETIKYKFGFDTTNFIEDCREIHSNAGVILLKVSWESFDIHFYL